MPLNYVIKINSMSNDFIPSIHNRAQPAQVFKYKLALLMLFKIYRDKIPTHEWLALNGEQTFTYKMHYKLDLKVQGGVSTALLVA